MPRRYTTKLGPGKEREVVLSYLCGINNKSIPKTVWDISHQTRDIILYKRSLRWNDQLVEFYRKTPAEKRMLNSAHLYLSFNKRDVPKNDVINEETDLNVYELICKLHYLPLIEEILKNSCLEDIISTKNGAVGRFREALFGPIVLEKYINSVILDRLKMIYDNYQNFSLKELIELTRRQVTNHIKNGAFGDSELKTNLIRKSLDNLSCYHKLTIKSRFGIDQNIESLRELATKNHKSYETIRYYEKEAIKRLINPFYFPELQILRNPITDYEINAHLEEIKLKKVHLGLLQFNLNTPINELPISTRLKNVLISMKISDVRDILNSKNNFKKSKIKGLGRISKSELESLIDIFRVHF